MMQEFVQEVKKIIDENVQGLHTAIPGVILSFDPGNGLATVLPSMKFKKPDGTKIDYPQITGVPVVFQQVMGQQATIAYPIKPGDGCLIIAAEQSIDFWLYGQETDTDLPFDLTNSICIPGLFVKANSVMQDACSNNAIVADVQGTRMTIKDGNVTIDSKKVNITGDLEINGTITSTSATMNVTKGITRIEGELRVNGPVIVSQSVTAGGNVAAGGDVTAEERVSLANHVHTGDSGGTTTPPL